FDYLPSGTTLAMHGDVSAAVQDFWRETATRHKMAGGDPDRPLLAPREVFVPAEEFFVPAKDFSRVDLAAFSEEEKESEAGSDPISSNPLPPVAVDRRANDPLATLKHFVQTSGLRVMVAAESPGRRETMASYFAEYGLKAAGCTSFEEFLASAAPFLLCVSPVSHAFIPPAQN